MADKEYIEREALLNMRFSRGFNNDGVLLVPFGEVTKAIRLAPAADVVEVRHGGWASVLVQKARRGYDNYYVPRERCSLCNAIEREQTNYCPCCGAKMDGGDGE